MINIKVNKKVIKSLNPCKDRFENYLAHYPDFNGSILEFLDLDNISVTDKIWVTLRLLPREQLEYFAIDCAFSITAAVDGSDDPYVVADAAYVAAYAVDTILYTRGPEAAATVAAAAAAATEVAAYAAAVYTIERDNQVEVLKYLIKTAGKT